MVGQVGGKWPRIKKPAELVLTPVELAKVQGWAASDPELVMKIKRQSDAYSAAIDAYNKQATEHNKKVVSELGKALGWSEQDILDALKGE